MTQSLFDLFSVLYLIFIVDLTNSGVIGNINERVNVVPGHAMVGVQGAGQGIDNTS